MSPTSIELVTERLILRRWTDADRAPFAELSADPEVARFLPSTLTRAESDAVVDRFRTHFEERGFGFWAMEERNTGEFCGFTGLWTVSLDLPFAPAVEIGWRLARAHWGKGYATEAARASLHDGFTRLGLDRIVSFTVPANRPSWSVMERLGMTRVEGGDFDHPRLPEGHPLRRHILYDIRKQA